MIVAVSTTWFKYISAFMLACAFAAYTHGDTTGWTGQYQGFMNQERTMLTIDQQADRISGRIVDDNNYTYTIDAEVTGNHAQGTLYDPAAGGSMMMEATLDTDEIILNLYQLFLDTRINELQISYQRFNGDNAAPAQTTEHAVPADDIDRRLVGTWRYTSTYVSGDFSVASDYTMVVNADGTYAYGEGRIAGGGSSRSFDSGTGGSVAGHWMSQNNQLMVNDGGGWNYYASYMCDGARLLLTFPNGNKQIWERID